MPKVRQLLTRWMFKGDTKKLKEFNRGLSMAKRGANRAGKSLMWMAGKAKYGALALAGVGVASVKMAADAEEAASKFDAVFKGQAATLRAWSEEFGKAAKRSKFELQGAAADFGALLNAMGFADEETARLSKRLTELTVDLGSFHNEAESDVLASLKSGLIGNMEPVLKYGAILKATNVEQELIALGLAKSNKAATEQQRVMARLSLLTKATTTAQGDAVRTSGSFTNQMKGMSAAAKDMAIKLGSALIPHLKDLIKQVEPVVEQVVAWFDANKELVDKGITKVIREGKRLASTLWSILSVGWQVLDWLGGLKFLLVATFTVAVVNGIFAVVGAVKTLAAAFALGLGSAAAIAGLIGVLIALGAYMIANWEDIAYSWGEVWDSIVQTAKEAVGWIGDLIDDLIGWFDKLPGHIKRGLGKAGPMLMPNVQVAMAGAAAGPGGAGGAVTNNRQATVNAPVSIYLQPGTPAQQVKAVGKAAGGAVQNAGRRALVEAVKR